MVMEIGKYERNLKRLIWMKIGILEKVNLRYNCVHAM